MHVFNATVYLVPETKSNNHTIQNICNELSLSSSTTGAAAIRGIDHPACHLNRPMTSSSSSVSVTESSLSPSTVVHVAGGLASHGKVLVAGGLAARGGEVLVVAGGLSAHGNLATHGGKNHLVRFSLLASPFSSSLLLLLLSLIPLRFGGGC
jgi:hypothetical protein